MVDLRHKHGIFISGILHILTKSLPVSMTVVRRFDEIELFVEMWTLRLMTESSTLPDEASDKFPAIKTHGYRFSKCALLQLELSGSVEGAYFRSLASCLSRS